MEIDWSKEAKDPERYDELLNPKDFTGTRSPRCLDGPALNIPMNKLISRQKANRSRSLRTGNQTVELRSGTPSRQFDLNAHPQPMRL